MLNAAGSIGDAGVGDIDVQAQFVNFNAGSQINLSDNDLGITIDVDSMANGGSIVATGDITVAADIVLSGLTRFQSGNDIVISSNSIVSNTNSAIIFDANGRFAMADATQIDANAGRVSITANDVAQVSDIRSGATGNAITISAQSIQEVTSAETANLTATNGRIVLDSSANIGFSGIGDIDIQSPLIAFNAPGEVALSDLAGGLNIDADSSASNGLIETNGTLTVSADVSVTGTTQFVATDDIVVQNGASVTQNSDSQLSFSSDNFRMDDGALINSAGQVAINANLDTLLSQVNSSATNNAIVINAGSNIVDNSAGETANLASANGRIVLNAGTNIGSAGSGDIDIQSQFLAFNTPGEIVLSDLSMGVDIDQTSSANRATIRSAGLLVFNADVSLGASSQFTSADSTNINDDIRFENNAIVSLNSNVDSELNFTAGDDIIFDSGRIITAGTGSHFVSLTADNEIGIDSDRGSVSTTAGATESIVTNDLNVRSFDGIGDSNDGVNADQPIRVNVDRLTAVNSGTSDILFTESDSIELLNVQTTDGAIFVSAGSDIFATIVVSGETEAIEDNADDVTLISTNGSIHLSRIMVADDLRVESPNGNILDETGALIDVDGDALFVANELIELANLESDFLRVLGNATFDADRVEIGQDQRDPGSTGSNTFFGSVTIIADSLVLVENDAIEFSGDNNFNDLYVFTNQTITNAANTVLNVSGHIQLNAGEEIVLGNQANDSINFSTLGLVTENAHIELDSSVVIDGSVPDQFIGNFGLEVSQGTEVTNTLYLTSTGSIEHSVGQLNAVNLGLRAGEFVHLAAVSELNQNVAISAGTSGSLTDSAAIETLQALANIENSEVNAALGQSIAISHEGQLNVSSVSSHFDFDQIDGFQTLDGSVFATSVNELSIQQDILARSPGADPQVTIYSAVGNLNNPGVQFDGGQIEVVGNSNAGIVNSNQTFANFFGDDGFVIRGTTEILVLNTDGTADQDLVLDYGHEGESGYRVGIVWDKDNQPGSPVEVINTFTPGPDVATEAYEDEVYQNNPTTLHSFSGEGGERVTLPKILRYSKDAVILHQETPNVFSTVTVRNDQDINLFTGSLEAASNSLNETDQTLRAEFDAPKKAVPNIPKINPINPIEIKTISEQPLSSSAPENSNSLTFARDVAPFESGELKWVQVTIPLSELEESGEDVRIKDPTKAYPKSQDAEINELDDEIGDNEVEKIINEIESDKVAEPGYWYKIFKDYQNRDDELFFYHFKTGDTEADNDSNSIGSRSQDDTTDQSKPSNTDDVDLEILNRPGSDFAPSPDSQLEQNSLDELHDGQTRSMISAPRALSAVGILAASLVIQRSQSIPKKQSNQGDPNQETSRQLGSTGTTSEPSFSRLDRIKRKIRNALSGADKTTPPNEQ